MQKKELHAIAELMKNVASDSGVPRNIRSTVMDAAEKMVRSTEDLDVRVGTAIYSMEDIANDINMPSHTRTEIWGIISALETAKEKLNKK